MNIIEDFKRLVATERFAKYIGNFVTNNVCVKCAMYYVGCSLEKLYTIPTSLLLQCTDAYSNSPVKICSSCFNMLEVDFLSTQISQWTTLIPASYQPAKVFHLVVILPRSLEAREMLFKKWVAETMGSWVYHLDWRRLFHFLCRHFFLLSNPAVEILPASYALPTMKIPHSTISHHFDVANHIPLIHTVSTDPLDVSSMVIQ